jgi:hypothetical protein
MIAAQTRAPAQSDSSIQADPAVSGNSGMNIAAI